MLLTRSFVRASFQLSTRRAVQDSIRTTVQKQRTNLPSVALGTSSRTHARPITSITNNNQQSSDMSKVLRSEPLSDKDAKWVGLRAIYWQDPTGKERKWESADRRTRKGDADAVAVCCIIQRPSVEPHILLVSQFRPPVNQSVIEMPAGLIDQGEEGDEGAKRAALRELKEETGYGTDKEGGKIDVKLVSNIMVNDPTWPVPLPSMQGMSGANMKLCVIRIDLADDSPEPVAEPDEGEFIEKHLVPLHGLMEALLNFQKKGFAVDARLAHAAIGIELGLGRLGAGK